MFHFVANLKPYTLRRPHRQRQFDAYLLSVDYAREHGPLAPQVRAAGRILCLDNGNFDRIGQLIERWRPEAVALHARRRVAETRLGRYARPADLSARLIDDYRALAERVAAAVREPAALEHPVEETLQRQRSFAPTYLVGPEDFAVPVTNGLGIQREYSGLPTSWYADAADRALAAGAAARTGQRRTAPVVFDGVHALDWDSAYAAGKAAGAARSPGIATGVGAALDDRTWIDYRVVDGVVRPLAVPIPRPYLRVAEVVGGLSLGYAEARDRRLPLHALGAGSPILVVLIGALSAPGTFVATDSTSPIKDAASSATISVYVDRPAALKLKAHRVVEVWLEDNIGWSCRCAACRSVPQPDDATMQQARAWWQAHGHRRLDAPDLRAPSPLAEWFPFLGVPADPALARATSAARVAHNHQILQRLETAIRRAAARGRIVPYVDNAVSAYLGSRSDPRWAAAVVAAWDLLKPVAEALDGVRPGGDLR